MINVEYTDNGKKVIIPVEVWETFKDVFEYIQLYELILEHKNQELIYASEDSIAEEYERNMNMGRKEKLLKIFNESRGILPKNFKFDRQEIHERQSVC